MKELNEEAKKTLDAFLKKKLIPTGIVASIIGLVIGFAVNDWARSDAYSKAITQFSTEISKSAAEIGNSAGQVEFLLEQAREDEQKLSEVLTHSVDTRNKLLNILNNTDTVNQAVRFLSKSEEFKSAIAKQNNQELKKVLNSVQSLELQLSTTRFRAKLTKYSSDARNRDRQPVNMNQHAVCALTGIRNDGKSSPICVVSLDDKEGNWSLHARSAYCSASCYD